jgi:hypothetical protein
LIHRIPGPTFTSLKRGPIPSGRLPQFEKFAVSGSIVGEEIVPKERLATEQFLGLSQVLWRNLVGNHFGARPGKIDVDWGLANFLKI